MNQEVLVPERECDLLIVGGGPAGLSSAIYAGSEGLNVKLVEAGVIGGQARESKSIKNFVGHLNTTGERLMVTAMQQAASFGVEFTTDRIVDIRRDGQCLELVGEQNNSYRCRMLLLALGVNYTTLAAKNAAKWVGRGISYRTMPEAVKGRHIVVGGANSAAQAAVYLADAGGCEVILIARSPLEKSMSYYLIRELSSRGSIKIITGAVVKEALGNKKFSGVVVGHANGDPDQIIEDVRAMHVFVGSKAKTLWLKGKIALDSNGFILTGNALINNGWSHTERLPLTFETSEPGVFAVGDARARSVKRIASAVGEGASLLPDVFEYMRIQERGVQVLV